MSIKNKLVLGSLPFGVAVVLGIVALLLGSDIVARYTVMVGAAAIVFFVVFAAAVVPPNRNRVGPRSSPSPVPGPAIPPPPPQTASRPSVPSEQPRTNPEPPQERYRELLTMVMGNEGTAEQLIEYERRHHPNASRSVLIDFAIDRIRNDIRRHGW